MIKGNNKNIIIINNKKIKNVVMRFLNLICNEMFV